MYDLIEMLLKKDYTVLTKYTQGVRYSCRYFYMSNVFIRATNGAVKNAFDNIPDLVLITDIRGRILYTNKKIQEHTGYSEAEAVGLTSALWGRRMSKDYYRNLWDTIKNDIIFSNEILNIKKNGNLAKEHLCIFPVKRSDSSTSFYFGIYPENSFSLGLTKPLHQIQTRNNEELFKILNSVYYNQRLGCQSQSLSDYLNFELVVPTEKKFIHRQEDKDLVISAQKDFRSYALIYQKYYSDIYKYCFGHLRGDTDAAQDLTQETFVRAMGAINNFSVMNANYLTYLRKISLRLIINLSRHGNAESLEELEIDPPEPRSICENQIFNKDLISRMMTSLTALERKVIRLKYFSAKSIRDIALRINKSENAVKLILSRTRNKMKRYYFSDLICLLLFSIIMP